jgi:hypothetical protein
MTFLKSDIHPDNEKLKKYLESSKEGKWFREKFTDIDKEHGFNSCLSGGFLVGLITGSESNDLDIFIQNPKQSPGENISKSQDAATYREIANDLLTDIRDIGQDLNYFSKSFSFYVLEGCHRYR